MFCLLYDPNITTILDHWEDNGLDYMDFCRQSNVSALQHILCVWHCFRAKKQLSSISWLTTVILEPKKKKVVIISIFSPCICHAVMGPDAMILIFKYLFLSWFFHSPPSSSSRGSLPLLHFLPLEQYLLHIRGCWCFSCLSWFQLVSQPAWHFSRLAQCID